MKIINAKRLVDMLQDMQDLDALVKLELTKEEIEGYLDFFAVNFVTPLTTVLQGFEYEKHQ